MSLIKRGVLSALLVALALSVAMSGPGQPMAAGETKYVDATGMAGIVNNDTGHARDKALEDARRKAVESVVGVMVDSETLVENFQLVNDRIYSQSAGFICGEKITNERQDQYNYYVTINACVQLGNLEDNLLAIGICLRRIGDPRTMLMIAEQNVGENIHGWWDQGSDLSIVETKIMEDFGDKGFQLIDPKVASGNFHVPKAIRGEPSPADAVAIGKAFSAEYVVIGKALATCKPKDEYGFFNCYANITARIVKVDNGKIIGTATGNGKMAHIEEHESGVKALQKAAGMVAPALIKKVTMRCEKETSGGGNEVTIQLQNVGSLAKLNAFKKACQQIRGVNAVYQRTFSGGVATIEITYKGRAEDLAEEIERATGANVTDISANVIKVRLK